MITTNVINVIFKSGATQLIVCLNATEAQRVYVEILQAMVDRMPIVAVEDDVTAVTLVVGEIASLALGEHTSARIEQAPRRERPTPQPVRRPERALIAN